ncbi:MAG: red chlorophyll catabolite reductase [Xenococcaceae cyanobacterium]
MIAPQPGIDNTSIFTRLWDILGELRQKLDARFELHPNPSTEKLKTYSAPDGETKGSLNTFSGSEVDWLVHSWIRNPKSSFSNMHLTIWLEPHIQVPHLAFALGTIPETFFYMDYIPRTDLSTDLEYLDRYYEPINATYLALQADPHLSSFISKNLYIRQVQSATSLCYTCTTTEDSLNLIRTVAHEMLDRWLIWVNEAKPVPVLERAALAERDLLVRRTVAERDPANKLVVQIFGSELTNTLVRALWGGDRVNT